MSQTFYKKGSYGFDNLITNPPKCPFHKLFLSRDTHGDIAKTRRYLHTVVHGDGMRAYCPFVKKIEENNAYHVKIFDQAPDMINLESILQELEDQFHRLSPQQTSYFQAVDDTTVIASFAHPDCYNAQFTQKIDAIRDLKRQYFLDQGLMIAQMHPFHPRGGQGSTAKKNPNEELYIADLPLLMIRRMHREDKIFMNKQEEQEAYDSYFRPSNQTIIHENNIFATTFRNHEFFKEIESILSYKDCVDEFLSVMLHLSFQTQCLLEERQKYLLSDELKEVFEQHYQEEYRHDQELLREIHTHYNRSIQPIQDTVLQDIFDFFLLEQKTTDNYEKLMLNFTLERAASEFYSILAPIIQKKFPKISHFQKHDECDEDHYSLGIEYLNNSDIDAKRLLIKAHEYQQSILQYFNRFYNILKARQTEHYPLSLPFGI